MYVCLQYFMKRVFYVFLQVSLWVSKALGGFKALSLTYILEYCIFTFVRFFYLLSYPRNFESGTYLASSDKHVITFIRISR